MRFQPPSSNNPSNPLAKVATLTLDREYVSLSAKNTAKVLVSLSFKRSRDLKGTTQSNVGEDITVCFTMAVRRAVLELSVSGNDGERIGNLHLSNVAFHSEFLSSDRVSETLSVTNRGTRARRMGGGLGLSMIGKKLSGRGNVNAEVESATSTSTAGSRKITRKTDRRSVLVTFATDSIHWEIDPSRTGDWLDDFGSGYLQGDVFKTKRKDSGIACIAKWNAGRDVVAIMVKGSVFTFMDDLLVSDIKFLDAAGEEKRLEDMMGDRGLYVKFKRSVSKRQSIAIKQRILKQVIRKHLVSQGMTVEGARVEICKAYA